MCQNSHKTNIMCQNFIRQIVLTYHLRNYRPQDQEYKMVTKTYYERTFTSTSNVTMWSDTSWKRPLKLRSFTSPFGFVFLQETRQFYYSAYRFVILCKWKEDTIRHQKES